MSKKIKLYFTLVPLLFVMLLNCFCYGQVIAADDSTIPTDALYLSEAYPEILEVCDFREFENLSLPSSFTIPENYLYCGQTSKSDYNSFVSGSSSRLKIWFVFLNLDNISIEQNDFAYFTYDSSLCTIFTFYYRSDSSFVYDSSSSSSTQFIFYPDTFNFARVSGMRNPPSSIVSGNNYTVAFQSNVIDVDFESGVLNVLDVRVAFNPELAGEVDRSVTLDDGSTALKNSLTMIVRNNSKFDIQYRFDIFRKEDLNEYGSYAAGVYPVFTYYSKEWVYGNSLDSNASFWNDVEKQNKATAQHILWSGRTDSITFNYSQLPLSEGVEYTARVTATRNDYKYASEIIVPSYEDIYPDLYQVYQSEVVYRSDFTMKQYKDITYDRSENSNGVLPYQGKDDMNTYENSYFATEDSDGNIDYEGKDVYNDPDSWYNNDFNHDINHDFSYGGLVGDKESGGSSDGSFSSFASSFTNYFQFISVIFNYFPVGVKNVFLIGFVGIMVVVLLKVVFKS